MWEVTFNPKRVEKPENGYNRRKLIVSVESSDQQQHAFEGYIEVLLMLQYNERMIVIVWEHDK